MRYQHNTRYVPPGRAVNVVRRQLRLSKGLAAWVSAQADNEGISDNAMVLKVLERARRRARQPPIKPYSSE